MLANSIDQVSWLILLLEDSLEFTPF